MVQVRQVMCLTLLKCKWYLLTTHGTVRVKIRYGMRGIQGEIFYFHEFVNNNLNTEAYMRTGKPTGKI